MSIQDKFLPVYISLMCCFWLAFAAAVFFRLRRGLLVSAALLWACALWGWSVKLVPAVAAVVGIPALMVAVYFILDGVFDIGHAAPRADLKPDPHNGMPPGDVAFHLQRGTYWDAHVLATAARLWQQDQSHECGIPVAVTHYEPYAPYDVKAYAGWILDHHPEYLDNPQDLLNDLRRI